MKPKEKPTAREILNLLDSMWLSEREIMIIAFCGKSKANQIMKDIKELIDVKYKKKLPKNCIPTEELINYLNINVSYLKKISKE